MNPLLFGPVLIKRALDDLGAIAHAARQVDAIPQAVIGRLDGLSAQLDRFREDVQPLRRLSDVEAHLAAVRTAVEPLGGKLDALSAEVRPIEELSAVRAQLDALRAGIERLGGTLDELQREVEPLRHLAKVRAGIEPLDDDLRQVRESIDTIEPLVKGMGSRIEGIDGKLTEMSGDLAPVGDLAEKMPGVTRGNAKRATR
jgi:chromosome segregation ATPase